jgi:hypothetical protein
MPETYPFLSLLFLLFIFSQWITAAALSLASMPTSATASSPCNAANQDRPPAAARCPPAAARRPLHVTRRPPLLDWLPHPAAMLKEIRQCHLFPERAKPPLSD